MTPEQYERVRVAYLAAREKNQVERAALLDNLCGEDALVREEVQSLLSSAERADRFLKTPALHVDFPVDNASQRAASLRNEGPGKDGRIETTGKRPPIERLGQYRILDVLGAGGMGVVYRAQQERPRRTVALKVIKPGIDSAEALSRFAHEGEILGRLQHPGIAQVFETGTADAGSGPQPYFAMELIRGVPLADFASSRRLDIPARLELVAKVCDAVHHAHQKGVIHRDLKPGNILVDASDQPKILDFGVARVTDADVNKVTLQTAVGQLVGTIAYMSPEQVHGDPSDLDTRSDVYSLGVICYELLTGRLPVDIFEKSIPQAARAILEEEPPLLSSVNRLFRGDIEAIVAKALEKNRVCRYQSASDFADDIRRHLSDQPIAARPMTTMYQLRKFARRNRALVASVTVAFASLTAGLIYVTQERDRAVQAEALAEQRREEADRQRVEAERQSAIARAVNDFLNDDLLAAVNPDEAGPDVTVREVLDKAAWSIEGRFNDQPLVEASIRDTIGRSYSNLGLYDKARAHLETAVEIGERLQGADHPESMATLGNLALLMKREGRLEEAEESCRHLLDTSLRVLGEDAEETLRAMNNLAAVLATSGELEEAETLMRRTVQARRSVLGDEHPATLTAGNNLGMFLIEIGKAADAEALLRQVLETERRVLGEEHPDTITTLDNMASAAWTLGRFPEAETQMRQVLEIRRRLLGEDHSDTLAAMNNLAAVLRASGKLTEAGSLFREALDLLRDRLGNDHHKTLVTMNNLAGVLKESKEYEEGESLYRECLHTLRQTLGPKHPRTLGTMNNLAALLDDAGKPAEAEPLYREALSTLRGIVGDEHPTVLAMMNNLAHLLRKQGKFENAENLYGELLALAERALPQGHWHLGLFNGSYGECLVGLERYDAAEDRYIAAYTCLRSALGESDRQTRAQVERLIDLYTIWGKQEEAAIWETRLSEMEALSADAHRADS